MPFVKDLNATYFYSHGKLLLTGEYFVLDGAKALAIPTLKGQSLTVRKTSSGPFALFWKSFSEKNELWFQGEFNLPSGKYLKGSDQEVGLRLEQILQAAHSLSPELWNEEKRAGLYVNTFLEFPNNWGLGTSSTLIANLANWWKIDPYQLLARSFGGSGYDLACAQAEGPIFYQLHASGPQIKAAPFFPSFSDQIYFLFLEQKQNSRAGIERYKAQGKVDQNTIRKISRLSEALVAAETLSEFCEILDQHEKIVSEKLKLPGVKSRLFSDFSGSIKSLGAWGGDFVMIASDRSRESIQSYFSKRGFPVFIPYSQMVLG